MGLFSSSVSIIRYQVTGELKKPVIETVRKGLQENMLNDMDEEITDKLTGWTSLEDPFNPDFTGSKFIIEPYFVFSLRIDKRSISPKIIKKQYSRLVAEQLKNTGRDFLSKSEKRSIKDHVINTLTLRIPPIPNIYDLIWNHEDSVLFFFTTLKAANEELETLFFKSFNLTLKRMIPFTMAEDPRTGLSDAQKDVLLKLTPTNFLE